MDFKRFGIWIVSLAVLGILCWTLNHYSAISCWFEGVGGLDLATFVITLAAFLAAAYAIWQQHKAGIKQEIIGAWQVLANKASGNSGKIEAIEFLAKQGKSLRGIDMSEDTHKGRVYLQRLNVSKKELGKRVDLIGANFEEANLWGAHFEGSDLSKAHFEGADLSKAHFEGTKLWNTDFERADLSKAHFEGAEYLENTMFKDSYIVSDNKESLPSTLESERFKFDFILNDDGTKKSEPYIEKVGRAISATKYFIQLIEKEPKNEMD